MSTQTRSFEISKTASEDLSSKQFHIVQMDASGDAEAGEGATDLIIGVLQNKPESGQEAHVRFMGTSKVKTGGVVGVGAWVTATTNGTGVATTTDGDIVIGRALVGGASGDIIEVQLGIQHLFIA